MSLNTSARQLARSAGHYRSSPICAEPQELTSSLSKLFVSSPRYISSSRSPQADKQLLNVSSTDHSKTANSKSSVNTFSPSSAYPKANPVELRRTPEKARANAEARAKANIQNQQKIMADAQQIQGSLASNSMFAEEISAQDEDADERQKLGEQSQERDPLVLRNPTNMAQALNPRPVERARWQRKMVIQHIRRGGRLTREMVLARTERSHLSRSHFLKTSMKKLAPLARQIAGKSVDEAILQMRFSKKKAARDVRQHLIQARDEAIVVRGMGISSQPSPKPSEGSVRPMSVGPQPPGALSEAPEKSSTHTPITTSLPVYLSADAGITPPRPEQLPSKSLKRFAKPNETDIYIAQAWVNRGPYGKEPEFRARGRTNILRPPHTGISLLLKEEKTRSREKVEKEAKAIRKRTGANMWTQLPDRKVTRQSQYVLW